VTGTLNPGKQAFQRPRRFLQRALLVAALSLPSVSSSAVKPTDFFRLQDLEKARSMTPEQFAELFERFFYEFYPRVMKPEDFLDQRAGDCDDYAVLGAYILGLKGYKTRLMQVQLTGDNVDHAVFFVTDKNVYLDYNNRKLRQKLVHSNSTIREVATLVANSFKQSWTTAFEFTYSYEERWKTIGRVIVRTDSPDRDADREPQARP
jgi:hypothetical protein